MSAGSLDYALRLSNSGFLGPLGAAGGGLVSFSARMVSLGATMAAGAVGAGALALAIKGIRGAASIEQTTVAFRTLVGDVGKADKALTELKALGASTPFEFPELATAGKNLIAFGEDAANVAPTLRRIGDIAAGVNAPIGDIATLFGKARVAGTLYAEDINQLVERGIPIISQFANQLGVSEGEIKKLGSEGKLTFEMLDRAFTDLTSDGGKFSNMMAKMAETTIGRLSTLKDAVNAVTVSFGKPVNDALNPIIKDLTERVEGMESAFERAGKAAGVGLARAYQAATTGKLGDLIIAEIHNAGDALSLVYTAATTGKLGDLLSAEFTLGGMVLANKFGDGLHTAMGRLSTFGEFIREAMEGAGEKFKASLLNAGAAFASRFGDMISGPIAGILDSIPDNPFFDAKTMAADIRAGAAARVSQNHRGALADADAASGKGDNMFAAAFKKLVEASNGQQMYGPEKMRPAMEERNRITEEIEAEVAVRKEARYKLHKELDAGTGRVDSFAPVMPTLPGGGGVNILKSSSAKSATGLDHNALRAADEAAANGRGGDKEIKSKIKLFNAKESMQRRYERMSQADKAKNFNEFSEFENQESGSGLNYLRKNPITDLKNSNLLEKSRDMDGMSGRRSLLDQAAAETQNPIGGALAKGSRLASQAIAGTVNPAARAVGNRAASQAKKGDNKDLTAVLRKIEEHTAKFAEVAVA